MRFPNNSTAVQITESEWMIVQEVTEQEMARRGSEAVVDWSAMLGRK
jgi:hypothetical protein